MLAACIVCWLLGSAQTVSADKAIANGLLYQVNIFPQEKVHLHTDKNEYLSGEKIWFKAYVVNALSHEPVAISEYVYVELADVSNVTLKRVKIKVDNGNYYGHVDIPSDAKQGIYTLRAYTMFMSNAGVDYFFRKPLIIINPQSAGNSDFKLADNVGQPKQNGGSGKLFVLDKGSKYTVGIDSTLRNDDLYLVAHCRAYPVFVGKIDTKNVLSFAKDSLPAGIVQFLLVDKGLNALDEKLVYSANTKPYTAKTGINVGAGVFGRREKISLSLSTDLHPKETASLSVSVTDDSMNDSDMSFPITDDLWFSSDIKGGVFDYGYYKYKKHSDWQKYMLTQVGGWQRYDIPAVLHGIYKTPDVPLEIGDVITGRVKTLFRNKPIKNAEISMISPDAGLYTTTHSDSLGRFELKGVDIPDSAHFIVQALTAKGGKGAELLVDETEYPLQSSIKDLGIVPDLLKKQSNPIMEYAAEQHAIQLKDIEVNATATHSHKQASYGFSALADESFSEKQIHDIDATCLHELFRRIAGVYVKHDKMYIRGAISIKGEFPAAIAINGVIVDGEYDLHNIQMSDVARVDVYKTGSTAIWGAAGGMGVLSVILKDGSYVPRTAKQFNIKQVRPLGFQRKEDFKSPDYATASEKNSTVADMRTTIYWNPQISLAGPSDSKICEFYSADNPGTYTVTVEGVTSEGRLISETRKITIK